ncbi:MAG: GTP 3',8-cyclase MoaA, partial [Pseudonocardiaceae bacterium]
MTSVSLGIPVVRSTDGPDPARPDHPGLLDRYGRLATDLRVSLTDKCNLRCTYCMPPEGLDWMPEEQSLTDDEVVRAIRIAVEHLGVRQVRFTGGEPLLRRGLEQIVSQITSIHPRPRVSLTSNGIGLDRRAEALAAAGLDRVNISLDTLDPERFRQISLRNQHKKVLEGLRAAADTDLRPVKVNTVLVRGMNDDEALPLLRYCLEHGYELRFIEQMPLDAQHGWDRSSMVTAAEIMNTIRREYRLDPHPEQRGSAPAEKFLVDGGPETVCIIASVSEPFCADCDRTRLTADGQLRSCLFSQGETDLRGPMRSGAD